MRIEQDGGTMCFDEVSSVAVTGCLFSHSAAKVNGGVLYFSRVGHMATAGCSFMHSSAGVRKHLYTQES